MGGALFLPVGPNLKFVRLHIDNINLCLYNVKYEYGK
jgi:hypothetical protein